MSNYFNGRSENEACLSQVHYRTADTVAERKLLVCGFWVAWMCWNWWKCLKIINSGDETMV